MALRILKAVEFAGKNAWRSLLVPSAIRAFQQAAARSKTPEEALALATNFNHGRIRITPSQIPSEILGLLELLATQPPKTMLEIGTYRGGTLFLFSRVVAPDALIISLDLPADYTGRLGYPRWRRGLFRGFARAQQRIELVQADSHQPATVKQIEQLLGGRQLDFLLIDGDHSYEGVKHDYALYTPLVAQGGLIAFHDIVPRTSQAPCGVPQFWKELKQTEKATEFVGSWQQDGYGIGVVRRDGGRRKNQ